MNNDRRNYRLVYCCAGNDIFPFIASVATDTCEYIEKKYRKRMNNVNCDQVLNVLKYTAEFIFIDNNVGNRMLPNNERKNIWKNFYRYFISDMICCDIDFELTEFKDMFDEDGAKYIEFSGPNYVFRYYDSDIFKLTSGLRRLISDADIIWQHGYMFTENWPRFNKPVYFVGQYDRNVIANAFDRDESLADRNVIKLVERTYPNVTYLFSDYTLDHMSSING